MFLSFIDEGSRINTNLFVLQCVSFCISFWGFFFFSHSSSFPIKMHATDAKTQKIKPDPNFFYEGRKVSEAVCKLEVVIDDQLSFTDHIATTARSCRFALYNIRKIRPFLSEQAAQLLVQTLVLSRLDYCNALLAGLPACTIKPLQLIQNAAARVVFNELKKAHVTPLFIRLHWLPIAARIKFKVLMFAYKTTTGTAPIYLNLLVQTYAPSRSLRSASERRLVVPSQRGYQITLTDLFLDCAQLVE